MMAVVICTRPLGSSRWYDCSPIIRLMHQTPSSYTYTCLNNMHTHTHQIVNDDIEVIEETIPKLESFNSSYSRMSSDTDDLFNRITSFSVSAISSQGLEVKGQTLQVRHCGL